jgi:hypothetical protein
MPLFHPNVFRQSQQPGVSGTKFTARKLKAWGWRITTQICIVTFPHPVVSWTLKDPQISLHKKKKKYEVNAGIFVGFRFGRCIGSSESSCLRVSDRLL